MALARRVTKRSCAGSATPQCDSESTPQTHRAIRTNNSAAQRFQLVQSNKQPGELAQWLPPFRKFVLAFA